MPLKKIRPNKKAFDRMENQHFEQRLGAMHKAQKDVDLDNSLNKFAEFKTITEKQVVLVREQEEVYAMQQRKETRKIELNRTERMTMFNRDWDK